MPMPTPEALRTLNTSHYLDYQDCKYAGGDRMLCTGVTEMRVTPEAQPFRLGGVDLVNLKDGRPILQVPVLLWSPSGMDMTHNPVWFEPSDAGLRGYFMPEDDKSTLYIYDAETTEMSGTATPVPRGTRPVASRSRGEAPKPRNPRSRRAWASSEDRP